MNASRIAELKKYLENRIVELREELEFLQDILAIVDQVLAEKSFIRADEVRETEVEAVGDFIEEAGEVVEETPTETPVLIKTPTSETRIRLITSQWGGIEDLGVMFVSSNLIRIVPNPEFSFRRDIPPFESFFIDRILEAMKRKDQNIIPRDQAFNYEIIEGDNGVIREILITNYGSEERIREIRSAARWCLEKMLEKIRRQA